MYNLSLSDRRAKVVMSSLSTRDNIRADRLAARVLGQLAPLASNDTEAGRATNRPVELVQK